jgi:hypothetical protein
VVEQNFATISMVMFTLLLGVIFSRVNDLVTSMDKTTRFSDKMDTVNNHMKALSLPAELRERIRDFYSHIWARDRSFEGLDALETDLSPSLVTELKLHTYVDEIEHERPRVGGREGGSAYA